MKLSWHFWRPLILVLAVLLGFSGNLSAQEKLPTEDDYYKLTALPIPEGVVLEAGGIEILPDGRLAVASRRGDIYLVENPFSNEPAKIKFQKFAGGLHEVLGLAYKDGSLYATQRCEVTRLKDVDGDGRADMFETVNDDWGINGDYHEYAFGSNFDKDDNLWVVLCLTGSFTSQTKYRGWCLRITPDGKAIPTCSGIRSPGGIGANHVGDMFYTDNQGPWNGTCNLRHLQPGMFMGNPEGNRWYDSTNAIGPRPKDPQSGSRMMTEVDKIPELQPPAVYFPYKKMGQSASGITCDTTDGKFGPFKNQLFVGDQTFSTVMRVSMEKVNGRYQGACFPFRQGFGSGSLALKMTSNGSLFVGGTNRGWSSRGNKPYSLERLNWTGKTPFEIHTMSANHDGFTLTFTEPVDAKTAADVNSYKLGTYTYIYQASYGSPEVDHTTPEIQTAEVAADGRSVRLKIKGLQRGHVHELHSAGVRSTKGLPLLHAEAYYTLNYIPAAK
jgi:glucose/arabinose dehydrogenase